MLESISKMESLLENLKCLPEILAILKQITGKEIAIQPDGIPSTIPDESNSKDGNYLNTFERLKTLLLGDSWPEALDVEMIAGDDRDSKIERSMGIIEYIINEDIRDKKFLDFGCGEGYTPLVAADMGASLAVGYDIAPDKWDSINLKSPHFLTSKWSEIQDKAPYDFALMYDVLDHMDGGQAEALAKIKSVLKPGGLIYIRCHPWCSRAGTHLYRTLNKAYAHIVFSDAELIRMGFSPGDKVEKIIHPHLTYKSWIEGAGLHLVNENGVRENVEDLFSQDQDIAERIKSHWKNISSEAGLRSGANFPTFQLQTNWVDYQVKNV